MTKYWLGKNLSKETIEKISSSLRGRTSPMKGRKGLSGKDNPMHGKKGILNHNFGKHIISEEHKQKISNLHKGKNIPEGIRKKISKSLIGRHCGAKNPNWNGGTTSFRTKLRLSEKYKQWRQDIFIRDNFTCQECGQKGGKLEAHHKKSIKLFILEIKENLPLLNLFDAAMIYVPLWDLNIGITLCKECHKEETFGKGAK